jgi:hypothetical protein
MNDLRHTWGRRLSLPMAVLLLALGPVLAFLDVQDGSGQPVLEQEHSEAACVVGHYHAICVLAGSLRSLHSQPTPVPQPRLHLRAEAPPVAAGSAPTPLVSRVRSRAPPTSA